MTDILISDRAQLLPALDSGRAEALTLDAICYHSRQDLISELSDDINKIKDRGAKTRFAMPYIFRKETEEYYGSIWEELQEIRPDGLLVRNYDELGFLDGKGYPKKQIFLDHYLYNMSERSADAFRDMGYENLTLSCELSSKELKHRKLPGMEIIVYGRAVLMISANCVKRTMQGCDAMPGVSFITDRMKKEFPVMNVCSDCYNLVLNADVLDITEQIISTDESLRRRYHFTTESADEVGAVLTQERWMFSKMTFTGGHYKRGVE